MPWFQYTNLRRDQTTSTNQLQNPILNAGIVQISTELERSVTDIAVVSGYLLLATGATGPFASALARKYGKRPTYLLSSIISTVGVILAETATGYSTFLAARIIQGVGIAAYEALGPATIGDLYFVHERGPHVATVLFLLSTISNFISIIAGVVTAFRDRRLKSSTPTPCSCGDATHGVEPRERGGCLVGSRSCQV